MRRLVLSGIALGLAGVAGLVLTPAVAAVPKSELTRALEAFGESLDFAERYHIERIDPVKAVRAGLVGMIESLDPGSSYIDPADFQDLISGSEPSASAGMYLGSENGLIFARTTADGGPAALAGIHVGDFLTAIDGRSMVGAREAEASRALKGEPGKRVVVSVLRPDGGRFEAPLSLAPPLPLSVSWRLEGDYGYIRAPNLTEKAVSQVNAAITELRAARPGLKGVVLDLRNNPGGLLDQAVGLADIFLDGGVVVEIRGREANQLERYHARPGDRLGGLPLVVLIDGGTASGAECIAAALQDRKRARIVGTTSFGTGMVQTVVPLGGGKDGALRITTSRMVRPNGMAIEGAGVTPDVLVARSKADAERPLRRSQTLPPTPPEVPPPGFDPAGDYPLVRAFALLNAGP